MSDEPEAGATKMFRVSWCTERIPCRCSTCRCMDTDVDNKCYAHSSSVGGVEVANPNAEMDYCPFYDEVTRKEVTDGKED